MAGALPPKVIDAVFEDEPAQQKGVEVLERAHQDIKCYCGAKLRYGVRDVVRTPPVPLAHRIELHELGPLMTGGWPHIVCPECNRALLVSGVF